MSKFPVRNGSILLRGLVLLRGSSAKQDPLTLQDPLSLTGTYVRRDPLCCTGSLKEKDAFGTGSRNTIRDLLTIPDENGLFVGLEREPSR